MAKTTATTTLTLNAAEQTALNAPLAGTGGFQSFGRSLQRLLQSNGKITLTDAQLGRIVRHLTYGQGTFETRLRNAFGRNLRALL